MEQSLLPNAQSLRVVDAMYQELMLDETVRTFSASH